MQDKNLSHIFNKFAGREVAVTEKHDTFVMDGKTYPLTSNILDANDPTIAEMKQTAASHGLKLRVWLPGTAGTMDYRMDRANAHVEKGADGKWRVGKKFSIG